MESGLHILAKEILDQGRLLRLPDICAEHAGEKQLIKPGWDATYRPRIVEPTLGESGSPNIRPDLIVDVEFNDRDFTLFIEIFVRHKTDQEKIEKLKKQGIAAIEIDLSRIPSDETREFYEEAILTAADRHWLHSRLAEKERRAMCARAEEEYGGIGEKIRSALREPQTSVWNAWVEPVTDGGLSELINLPIDGHECFRTTPDVWQAAILYRHVLSGEHIFEPLSTLRWLSAQDLLKGPFKHR